MCARLIFTVGIVAIAVTGLSGCGALTQMSVGEYQGGTSLAQVTSKFLNDQWGDFNPDDLQLLVQVAPTIVPQLEEMNLPELTDSQAQTLVDFLAANNVQTHADLAAVIEQAQRDPGSVENYEEVREVLEALAGTAGYEV